jgi:hypothetical protein
MYCEYYYFALHFFLTKYWCSLCRHFTVVDCSPCFCLNLAGTLRFLATPHAGSNVGHYSRQVEAAFSAKLSSQVRSVANSLYSVPSLLEFL